MVDALTQVETRDEDTPAGEAPMADAPTLVEAIPTVEGAATWAAVDTVDVDITTVASTQVVATTMAGAFGLVRTMATASESRSAGATTPTLDAAITMDGAIGSRLRVMRVTLTITDTSRTPRQTQIERGNG